MNAIREEIRRITRAEILEGENRDCPICRTGLSDEFDTSFGRRPYQTNAKTASNQNENHENDLGWSYPLCAPLTVIPCKNQCEKETGYEGDMQGSGVYARNAPGFGDQLEDLGNRPRDGGVADRQLDNSTAP
jgi:hypothetical protein